MVYRQLHNTNQLANETMKDLTAVSPHRPAVFLLLCGDVWRPLSDTSIHYSVLSEDTGAQTAYRWRYLRRYDGVRV